MTNADTTRPAAQPQQVRSLLTRALTELGVDEATIVPSARLLEDLELDSTEMVQVALELGRGLGFRVKLASSPGQTIQDVYDTVAVQSRDGQDAGRGAGGAG